MRAELLAYLRRPWRFTRATGGSVKSENWRVRLDPGEALAASEAALSLGLPASEYARRCLALVTRELTQQQCGRESSEP